MDDLPIDTSQPAVRDFLALVRLQILTPLSLLVNITTVAICAFIVRPTIGEISRFYPTSISPNTSMVAVYLLAIYIGQLGYCVLLVLARKRETKQALIKACGMSLVISNIAVALWAIAWSFEMFLISSILLGIILALLLYSNIVLLIYHAPVASRPLDTALIHAPMRLFLILPLMLTEAHSIFITIGHYWDPGQANAYNAYKWEGFAVLFTVNVLGAVLVFMRRDIIWCIGAAWVNACVWREGPKSAPVMGTAIAFTLIHPAALLVSFVWGWFSKKRRGGAIALPEEENGLDGNASTSRTAGDRNAGVSSVWG